MFLGSSSYFMKIHQHDNDGIISWLIAWRFKVSNLTVSYNCTLKVVTIGKSYDRVLRRFGWLIYWWMNEVCEDCVWWWLFDVVFVKKEKPRERTQTVNKSGSWLIWWSESRKACNFFFCCLWVLLFASHLFKFAQSSSHHHHHYHIRRHCRCRCHLRCTGKQS